MSDQAIQKLPGVTALEFIRSHQAEFIKVIPKHLGPERLLRIAEGAINRNPKLLACTAASLVRSVMEAAMMGLEPGVLGDGWLIPYNNRYKRRGEWITVPECQFQPGYQGIVKLALQSKSVASINADAIYAKDEFDYGLGTSPFIKHRPSLNPHEENELPLLFYCVVKLVTGGKQVTIMTLAQVARVREMSRAKNGDAWTRHFEQMGIKTVIKRAMKKVPKSPQAALAVATDDRREAGEGVADLFDLPEQGALPGETEPEEPKDVAQQAAEALTAAVKDKDNETHKIKE